MRYFGTLWRTAVDQQKTGLWPPVLKPLRRGGRPNWTILKAVNLDAFEKSNFWEKLNRGVSKPGCFPLFWERSRLCRGPFWDCSSWVLLIGWERGKGQIGKIPGPSPRKSGKSQKNRESPKRTKMDKKGQKVQIGKPPRLKPPRLSALEICLKTKSFPFCATGWKIQND